ncbi:hypothetical protein [Aliarcobacter butzleri]|uniref:hypothetical protein n=1 Tax=Aliarcobacter butzleri TaxID=28197 RepID=UPI003AFB222B
MFDKKILIFISLIVLLFIVIIKYDWKEKEKEKFTIYSSTNLIEKNSDNSYNYYLNEDNLLNININENLDNLELIEFDSNTLDSHKINDKETNLKSRYELVPGKYKLNIIYKENKRIETINFNVIYLYDSKKEEFSNFSNHWLFDPYCNNIQVLNEGLKIGGNCDKSLIRIEYKKNFDRDVILKFNFSLLNTKTIDMQLSFGERLYINFDNKKIKFIRKELNLNNKETINVVKEVHYNKFKNNNTYSVIFSREEEIYTLKITDTITKENHYEIQYKDDKSNIKNNQIYNNLRISVGRNNTIMLIESIEIN